jgi:hypothetical protein
MQLMIEALAQSMQKAGSTEAAAVARAMEQVQVQLAGRTGSMRAADHQFQQPLAVGVMERQGTPGVKFDVEGSGYGFRVVREITALQAELPSLPDEAFLSSGDGCGMLPCCPVPLRNDKKGPHLRAFAWGTARRLRGARRGTGRLRCWLQAGFLHGGGFPGPGRARPWRSSWTCCSG